MGALRKSFFLCVAPCAARRAFCLVVRLIFRGSVFCQVAEMKSGIFLILFLWPIFGRFPGRNKVLPMSEEDIELYKAQQALNPLPRESDLDRQTRDKIASEVRGFPPGSGWCGSGRKPQKEELPPQEGRKRSITRRAASCGGPSVCDTPEWISAYTATTHPPLSVSTTVS